MRTFTSESARWPGTLVTNEFLKWSELEKWEVALKEAQRLNEIEANVIKFYSILLPITLPVIKEWHIEGLPEKIETTDDLPASTEFVAFIVDCIAKLFQDTNSIEKN